MTDEPTGAPLFVARRHRRWCRRAHGAGFVTRVGLSWAGVMAGDYL